MALDPEATRRVLSRASQLEVQSSSRSQVPAVAGLPSTLSEDAVIEAATAAGLDANAVRLSLAIERLGPTQPATRTDTLLGSRWVTVERVVNLDERSTLRRLDELLVAEHHLHRPRVFDDRMEWRKRTDMAGMMQRAARGLSGGAQLGAVARIEARSSMVDPGCSIIRLSADRRGQRTGHLVGGLAVGSVAAAGAVVAGLLVTPIALAGLVVAAGAGLATAATGRGTAAKLDDRLNAAVDRVERGVPPTTLGDQMRRALGSLRR
jgi:hypothetical protein